MLERCIDFNTTNKLFNFNLSSNTNVIIYITWQKTAKRINKIKIMQIKLSNNLDIIFS